MFLTTTMAAAAGTTKDLCISALQQLQTQTGKYSNIVSIFETWFDEAGMDDETLQDEFSDAIDQSLFIEAAKDKKEIQNDEEAQQIFNAIKNALTIPTDEEEAKVPAPKVTRYRSLPVELLSTKISDKEFTPIRQRFKEQAPGLLPRDEQACEDILRMYVLSTFR